MNIEILLVNNVGQYTTTLDTNFFPENDLLSKRGLSKRQGGSSLRASWPHAGTPKVWRVSRNVYS